MGQKRNGYRDRKGTGKERDRKGKGTGQVNPDVKEKHRRRTTILGWLWRGVTS